jgi:hypothetical protein
MTKQYLRKASLIIGHGTGSAIDLSGLRFTFRVQRGDRQTPNSLHVRVYNVASNTAQKVEKEFSRIVLQAGYEGNFGIVFDGSLVQVKRGRESPTDTYLDITAADGDMAYNFAIVNTTLAAGSMPEDRTKVCTAAMAQLGVTEGYRPELVGRPLPRGKVMFGMARDHLETIARSTQMLWSIQDGKLQMVPETSYAPGEIPSITSESGMVGTPEQTQNGIKVKMLLNPGIKIGRLIRLGERSAQQRGFSSNDAQQTENDAVAAQDKLNRPEQIDGYYYVMTNEHWGDTSGNDWYTEATCLAVDATPIDSDLLTRAGQGTSGPVEPKLDVIKPYG